MNTGGGGVGGLTQTNTPDNLKKGGNAKGGGAFGRNGNDGSGEEHAGPSRKFFIQRLYDSFFAVMVELLKNKKISKSRSGLS
jgi:hypothetical protein